MNSNSAISQVLQGENVELDLATASTVIKQTQSLGTDWETFLAGAPDAILKTTFSPCISVAALREHVKRELDRPEQQGDQKRDRIDDAFDSALIYLQQYDIPVLGSSASIFIYRTPTEAYFNRARAILIFVIEFLRQIDKSDNVTQFMYSDEVTLVIRGTDKFFDVEVKVGLNEEAWIGFDFR